MGSYGEKGKWGGGARESCGGTGKKGQLWGRGEEGAVGGGDPALPVNVQESPAKVWVGGSLLQGWGH